MDEMKTMTWLTVGLLLMAFVNTWLGAVVLIIGLFKLMREPSKKKEDKETRKGKKGDA